MADLRTLKERRQDISDRAAGLIAARNRLAEEAERAGRVVAVKEWASKGPPLAIRDDGGWHG